MFSLLGDDGVTMFTVARIGHHVRLTLWNLATPVHMLELTKEQAQELSDALKKFCAES